MSLYSRSTIAAGVSCVLVLGGQLNHAQTVAPELPSAWLETAFLPPTGSTITVKAGDNLQNALNGAKPGDEVVLEAGATFTGAFVLPKKDPGNGWITIRSSRMEALPKPGTRVRPENAALMPKIVTETSAPALKTEPGAHHYRIMGIEIAVAPRVRLNYTTVYLGDGLMAEDLPTDIIFDRVYVHGAVLCHCKTGITLNSRRTAVIDSHISEYHTIDQDAQALLGYNGPGPFKIVNNYLEASGENVMFGGALASIRELVPSDIEFRRNHLAKPVRWRSSIIPAPQELKASPLSGGSLPPGVTYYYTVAAVGPGDYLQDLASSPAPEVAVKLAPGQGGVALSWSAVRYGDSTDSRVPAEYRVYRTADAPGAKSRDWVYFSVPAPDASALIDAGGGGAGGAPGTTANRWLVKNLFELKNARRVLVDANVMEYSWQHGQTGYAILLTPRVENGAMPWAVAEDVTITNNLIRHAGGGIVIMGMDDYCAQPAAANWNCRQSSRLLVRNNVFDDITAARWDGRGWLFQLHSSDALTIDHNTGINDLASIYMSGANNRLAITNNIMGGELISDGTSGSTTTLSKSAPGAVFAGNVVARALASRNTAFPNNNFLSSLEDVGFVDLAGGDYRLGAESRFRGSASDGSDPGANVAAVLSATSGVIEGVLANSLPRPSCDLNSDGNVNIVDAMALIRQVLALDSCSNGDLNEDTLCNVVDAQIIINAILTGQCATGNFR